MIRSATGAPSNYEELYENYFPMMRAIVARAGISPADVEDVAMEILTRFMERDGLSWYDPSLLHDVGRVPRLAGDRLRPARFQGILRSYTTLSCRRALENQRLRGVREPSRLEEPAGPEGSTWAEAHPERLAGRDEADEYCRSVSACESIVRARTALLEEAAEWGLDADGVGDEERQSRVYAKRRQAECVRAALALLTAARVASGEAHEEACGDRCTCGQVTAAKIGRMRGWSPSTAALALALARRQLAAVS